MPAQATHSCVSQGKLAPSSCTTAVQRADTFSSDAQEWRDPSAGCYLVLCLLCNLKQATEASWSSALPLLKALNNQFLVEGAWTWTWQLGAMTRVNTGVNTVRRCLSSSTPEELCSSGLYLHHLHAPHQMKDLGHRRVVVSVEQLWMMAVSRRNCDD